MSETDKNRRVTRQGVRELRDTPERGTEATRRSSVHSNHPEHTKRCYLCSSSAEFETSQGKSRRSRSRTSSTSSRSTVSSKPSGKRSSAQTKRTSGGCSTSEVVPSSSHDCPIVDTADCESIASKDLLPAPKVEIEDSDFEIKSEIDTEEPGEPSKLLIGRDPKLASSKRRSPEIYLIELESGVELDQKLPPTQQTTPCPVSVTASASTTQSAPVVERELRHTGTLASTAKPQPVPPPKPPQSQVPPTTATKPTNLAPAASYPVSAHIPKPQIMTSGVGPLTRLQAQNTGAQDAGHRQISASNIDEATLDQTFGISPKWHFIKSNHDESATWLDSATSDSILLELMYFAHDQGQAQQKEMEGQLEKELLRSIEAIEKLDCLDAFCKTFVREGRFRPSGKLSTSSAGKDDKYNRLFRMINADLQNLQRQHRILSMVCAGTADHEVHTLAQRENLRKLVEDLVHIVHPGDRGTYSEVYKVITENASYDQRVVKPQLSSLKLVAHPDIVVPFGGPVMAGGTQIRCDALEHKIRAKLPSLLIKMHFSDRLQDQKWPDLSQGKPDDSGVTFDGTINNDDIPLPTGTSTPTGTGSARPKGKDEKTAGSKTTPASSTSSRSGKRKQVEDTPPVKSKRHREDINTAGYEAHPPEAHVINEIYSEHVAQLVCSLAQTPMGYVKHCKHTVSASDDRDGTAGVTVLGMIVSGEDVYLTKLDASHDYLDSLVETFRMDQLSFSCMANPLNLYKGSHLRALLMFLRYACLNFPRTTCFLSD